MPVKDARRAPIPVPKSRLALKLEAAEQLAPIIRELQNAAHRITVALSELNKRKVQTPRGGSWHPQLVKRIVERLDRQ
jgi:hypothetical protein